MNEMGEILPDEAAQPDIDALRQSPARFVNREVSWLQFNMRVLEEAGNTNHPLLERMRFVSISANNLDEFFMVRVAGLKGQLRAGVTTQSADGLTPSEQLDEIATLAQHLQLEQQDHWQTLREELFDKDVVIHEAGDLSPDQVKYLQRLFREELPQQGVPVPSSEHGSRLAYRRRKAEGAPGQRSPPPSTTWMMARSPPSASQSKWRKESANKPRQHAAIAPER